MDRNELRLNEFCAIGNLEAYRDILREIFAKIDSAKCSISTRDDFGPSIHEFPDDNGKCRIRIPLRNFAQNPVQAIWVILHEFGHHQSGFIAKNDLTNEVRMKREIEAWEFARKEMVLIPEFTSQLLDFDNYAEECLEDYRKKLNCS